MCRSSLTPKRVDCGPSHPTYSNLHLVVSSPDSGAGGLLAYKRYLPEIQIHDAATVDVQKAHRRAATGISLRHSGHFLLVGSGGTAFRAASAFQAFMGATMVKYTAAATSRN